MQNYYVLLCLIGPSYFWGFLDYFLTYNYGENSSTNENYLFTLLSKWLAVYLTILNCSTVYEPNTRQTYFWPNQYSKSEIIVSQIDLTLCSIDWTLRHGLLPYINCKFSPTNVFQFWVKPHMVAVQKYCKPKIKILSTFFSLPLKIFGYRTTPALLFYCMDTKPKKENHTGLKWQEGDDTNFIFGWIVPLIYSYTVQPCPQYITNEVLPSIIRAIIRLVYIIHNHFFKLLTCYMKIIGDIFKTHFLVIYNFYYLWYNTGTLRWSVAISSFALLCHKQLHLSGSC